MAASIKLLPGATIRWHGRQYVIVDYGLDAIIGLYSANTSSNLTQQFLPANIHGAARRGHP
jgi:hypothetical protein